VGGGVRRGARVAESFGFRELVGFLALGVVEQTSAHEIEGVVHSEFIASIILYCDERLFENSSFHTSKILKN
jgi:hypothetical protein